jgi:aryl-alcohol dehydrogenase-like predicted oxidoreductase
MKGANGSPALMREYMEGTIKRLGTTPDLYYIHRIDPKTPVSEWAGQLKKFKEEGKCRYVGLSECGSETLRKACEGECDTPDTLALYINMTIPASSRPNRRPSNRILPLVH